MKNIAFILSISLALILGSFAPAGMPAVKVKTVVIDAGHGGKDPGAVGALYKEKDLALKVALEVGEIINEYLPEVNVIYTRKDDTFIELEERAQIANRNHADVFISIHCNAIPGKSNVKGTETFVMGLHKSQGNLAVAKKENAVMMLEENYEEKYEGFDPNSAESYILFEIAQNAYLTNSTILAENIEKQFKERVGRNSRGVKQAGLWVLWRTSMPSVLIELGFISNKQEEKYINSPLGGTYLASAIFRAFRDYKTEIEANN